MKTTQNQCKRGGGAGRGESGDMRATQNQCKRGEGWRGGEDMRTTQRGSGAGERKWTYEKFSKKSRSIDFTPSVSSQLAIDAI